MQLLHDERIKEFNCLSRHDERIKEFNCLLRHDERIKELQNSIVSQDPIVPRLHDERIKELKNSIVFRDTMKELKNYRIQLSHKSQQSHYYTMLSVVFPWLNNVPDDEKIAPIGVGYLVATKSGKSAEESYADALQKIHKKIPPQMERYLELI